MNKIYKTQNLLTMSAWSSMRHRSPITIGPFFARMRTPGCMTVSFPWKFYKLKILLQRNYKKMRTYSNISFYMSIWNEYDVGTKSEKNYWIICKIFKKMSNFKLAGGSAVLIGIGRFIVNSVIFFSKLTSLMKSIYKIRYYRINQNSLNKS